MRTTNKSLEFHGDLDLGAVLLQAGFHNRSLCLYSRLGFVTREPLSLLQGPPLGLHFPGYDVGPATAADVPACNRLCHRLHGFDRSHELGDATQRNTAVVVRHLGRITGYATEIGFEGHAVADVAGVERVEAAGPQGALLVGDGQHTART